MKVSDITKLVVVKVYMVDPPNFNRKRFSYTKKFFSVNEAQEHIELCKMADINFNNIMGYCERSRRFFKMEIKTKKKEPLQLIYIEPQLSYNG